MSEMTKQEESVEEVARQAFQAGMDAMTYGIMVLNWTVCYTPNEVPPLNFDDWYESRSLDAVEAKMEEMGIFVEPRLSDVKEGE